MQRRKGLEQEMVTTSEGFAVMAIEALDCGEA